MNAESKVPRVVKSRETEGKMSSKACTRKKWKLLFNVHEVSVQDDEEFWVLIMMIVAQQCEYM